jgi:hypothetical protein
MSNPFRDSSLWIRAIAFSAAIFGISLGLCGLNLGASYVVSASVGGPAAAKHPLIQSLSTMLGITGLCEIGGMAIGAAGIALSAAALLIQILWRVATRKGPELP